MNGCRKPSLPWPRGKGEEVPAVAARTADGEEGDNDNDVCDDDEDACDDDDDACDDDDDARRRAGATATVKSARFDT